MLESENVDWEGKKRRDAGNAGNVGTQVQILMLKSLLVDYFLAETYSGLIRERFVLLIWWGIDQRNAKLIKGLVTARDKEEICISTKGND